MTKYIALALTGLTVFSMETTQAKAQCLQRDLRIVLSWYPKYLRRPHCHVHVCYWRKELIRGITIPEAECWFLSTDSYYQFYGCCPKRWVRGLLTDVLEVPPCPRVVCRLVGQLNRCGCRKTIVRQVLAMRNNVPPVPPVPGGWQSNPIVVQQPPAEIRPPRTIQRPIRPSRIDHYRRPAPVNVIFPSGRGFQRSARPSVRLSINIPFRF
ncbi:MAG: hypothetical protein ACFCD0_17895 [Gemmataceae bacterium]